MAYIGIPPMAVRLAREFSNFLFFPDLTIRTLSAGPARSSFTMFVYQHNYMIYNNLVAEVFMRKLWGYMGSDVPVPEILNEAVAVVALVRAQGDALATPQGIDQLQDRIDLGCTLGGGYFFTLGHLEKPHWY